MEADEFDPQRLLAFGCEVHQEGCHTGSQDLQAIGGTAALMALQIQGDLVALARQPVRSTSSVLAVLLIAWVAGLALGWYTGRPLEASIVLLVMGGMLAWAALQADNGAMAMRKRDAWLKLKDMEAKWRAEESQGRGLDELLHDQPTEARSPDRDSDQALAMVALGKAFAGVGQRRDIPEFNEAGERLLLAAAERSQERSHGQPGQSGTTGTPMKEAAD